MTLVLTDYKSTWQPPHKAGVMTDSLREALDGLREAVDRVSRERSAMAKVEAAHAPDARLRALVGIEAELRALAVLPYDKPVRIYAQMGLRFAASPHIAAAHAAGWRLEDVFGVPPDFDGPTPCGFVYATSFLQFKAKLVRIDREGAKLAIGEGRQRRIVLWRPTLYNSGHLPWKFKAKLPTVD